MYPPVTIPHDAYVQRELITAGIFNVVLCAITTVAFVPATVPLSLWGVHGIAFDLTITTFMLTLIGNTVITALARRRLLGGTVQSLAGERCHWLVSWLPRHAAVRLPLLALLMAAVVMPLVVLAFWLLDIRTMEFTPYLVFKACYGPLVGALSVKPAVHAALRSPES